MSITERTKADVVRDEAERVEKLAKQPIYSEAEADKLIEIAADLHALSRRIEESYTPN